MDALVKPHVGNHPKLVTAFRQLIVDAGLEIRIPDSYMRSASPNADLYIILSSPNEFTRLYQIIVKVLENNTTQELYIETPQKRVSIGKDSLLKETQLLI